MLHCNEPSPLDTARKVDEESVVDAAARPTFDTAFREQLTQLFRWRRDVRRFRAEPLPPGLLRHLLDCAALAPSVGLSQPSRWVVVDDPARRAAVRANFTLCNKDALQAQSPGRREMYARLKLAGLDQAPCHLAAFSLQDPEQGGGLGRRTMPETVFYSSVMAVHTLWLAARAEGVGLGWVSILDPAAITTILDVPPHWAFVGYLCLGYPEAENQVPELERCGWEQRRASAAHIMQR